MTEPPARLSRIAILWRGDKAARRSATPETSRFKAVFAALADVAIDAEPVVYEDDVLDAVRAQLAAMARGSLPPDVGTSATALDTKLATLGAAGGRGPRGGGGRGGFGAPARAPGSVLPFYSISGLYYTVLGPLTQNGIDIPPTKAQVDTSESACKEFNATVNAWKTMLAVDVVGFNSLLTKNNLTPLKITPTALAVPSSCTSAPTATRAIK